MNYVFLVGRLVQNPEIKEVSEDKRVINIDVAVQRNFKNIDGEYETDFIRCVLWNGIANSTNEYCHKGDMVGIKGRLQSRVYEDDENNKKYVLEVIADKVSFLRSARKDKVNLCKYCGNETDSKDENVLCPSCRETFGHTFYSEL